MSELNKYLYLCTQYTNKIELNLIYMKKNYMLLAVVATFASATSFAQKPIVAESQLQEFWQTHPTYNVATQKPSLAKQIKRGKSKPTIFKTAPFDLITEQPAGDLKTLVGNLGGYYSIFGYIMPNTELGRAVDVVYGDDGNFYIKDPFSQFSTGSWLKGAIKGDTISVDPQTIYYEEANGSSSETICYAAKMKYGYVEDMAQNYWSVDIDNPTLKFIVRNDSIIMQNENGYAGLGLFYSSGEWTGFGEFRKILTPQTDVAVSLPKTVSESKEYVMTYGTYLTGLDTLTIMKKMVKIAKDGNDYYLTDLINTDDKMYVKGTFADGKLTLNSGQYMGVENTNDFNGVRYHEYFDAMGWKTVPTYNNGKEDSTYFRDQFVFDYDATTDTYIGENNYFGINGGNSKVNMRYGLKQPILTPFVEVNSAPAKPTIYTVEDMFDEYGYSNVQVVLTNTTEKGEFLNTHRLYYNLYIDDELLTFYPDEYISLKEEMVDVPFEYVDGEDFQNYKGRRIIYFYTTDFSRVALQEVYVDNEGVRHLSEPARWYKNAAGIKLQQAVNDKANRAETERYYDLGGRLVAQPEHGMYIKSTTYSDGSTVMKKVFVNK